MTKSGPSVDLAGVAIDYEHYVEKQILPILMMLPDYENVFYKLTAQRGFSF